SRQRDRNLSAAQIRAQCAQLLQNNQRGRPSLAHRAHLKSSWRAREKIRCPVWNWVDQFRAAIKEQDVGPVRGGALESEPLIFDKEISWTSPMNRFSLELNCH